MRLTAPPPPRPPLASPPQRDDVKFKTDAKAHMIVDLVERAHDKGTARLWLLPGGQFSLEGGDPWGSSWAASLAASGTAPLPRPPLMTPACDCFCRCCRCPAEAASSQAKALRRRVDFVLPIGSDPDWDVLPAAPAPPLD